VVRTIVGYLRYDTTPELSLLNKIWKLQSLMTNFFHPQQKLLSKVRNGAKVIKTYDRPRTPMFRADAHQAVAAADRVRLAEEQYADLKPAAIQRQNSGPHRAALGAGHQQGAAGRRPDPKRASADESTTTATRASRHESPGIATRRSCRLHRSDVGVRLRAAARRGSSRRCRR